MYKKNRPLTPHLSIYKTQITSIVSIFHRISGSFTGLIFVISICIFYFDFIFSEYAPVYFIIYLCDFYFYKFFINIINFLFIILVFHFCNGLRHISLDFGFGLGIKTIYITGIFVLFFIAIFLVILLL